MPELPSAFTDFALSDATLSILKARSFIEPTPIQSLVIPQLLAGNGDWIARARTGTGKTAAYALPMIEKLLYASNPTPENRKLPRALILAPTRELAMQISSEMCAFIGDRALKVVTVYGGQPVEIQLKFLRGGADFVVGTPGRVIDFMERGALSLKALQFAVLDEADEMLDMGFIEDIEKILSATPEAKQMLMFSATLPDSIQDIARRFMHDAQFISADDGPADDGASLTEQWGCEVRREDKFPALCRILAAEGRVYAMIFCRTRTDADTLTSQLQHAGFSAEALHGELTQNQRTRVIEQFKNHRFDMLVATDVAARGIDVNDLTHVINYAMPLTRDLYTHRIGRTGRAGKTGTAITLFTPSEGGKFAALRKMTKNRLEQRPVPDASKIIACKKERFAASLAERMLEIHPVYQELADDLLTSLDARKLAAALLEMNLKRELLKESYPALSGSKRRERFAVDRDRDRKYSERRRNFRRQEQKLPEDQNNVDDGFRKERRASERKRHSRSEDAPEKRLRPNLREWAMTAAGEIGQEALKVSEKSVHREKRVREKRLKKPKNR